MKPAYHIPLSDDDLKLLGELTVIMGQIDENMVTGITGLIRVDRPTANAIMGSTKVQDNANIWAMIIRQRHKDKRLLWLVDVAVKEFQALTTGRNDFMHAFYVELDEKTGTSRWAPNPLVWDEAWPTHAKRVRTGKSRPATDIKTVRDHAAWLSCLIAHVSDWLAVGSEPPGPWLERVESRLPPHPDTRPPRKAKGPKPPRGSSPR